MLHPHAGASAYNWCGPASCDWGGPITRDRFWDLRLALLWGLPNAVAGANSKNHLSLVLKFRHTYRKPNILRYGVVQQGFVLCHCWQHNKFAVARLTFGNQRWKFNFPTWHLPNSAADLSSIVFRVPPSCSKSGPFAPYWFLCNFCGPLWASFGPRLNFLTFFFRSPFNLSWASFELPGSFLWASFTTFWASVESLVNLLWFLCEPPLVLLWIFFGLPVYLL